MGMAEWTLEEAAADLRIAAAKLKTLPRRMRSGRRRSKRRPPLVKFILPPGSQPREDTGWCPAAETHCEPCRELCLSSSYARHAGLSPNVPVFPLGPQPATAGSACILPAVTAASGGAVAHFVPQSRFPPIAASAPLTAFGGTQHPLAVERGVPGGFQVWRGGVPVYATVPPAPT